MLTKETAKVPASKEPVQFKVSFDPTDSNNSVKIHLPNGKTFTTEKKEVMKHVTRAVIKACAENNMNKKAASLRPFMKDEIPTSPKQDKLREAFLDIPAAKRAKKEKGDQRRLTKGEGGAVKKGNWSNEEDVAILDHAAKFDGKDSVDWSALSLPKRGPAQFQNRYKVLSRKRGNWTKDEDDAILKYGQGKDVDWSAFVLPGRVAKQCSHRHKKLVSGQVDKRGNWTKEEDDAIMKHAEGNGDTNWSALELSSRNAKQCKKRYGHLTSKKKACPIKKGGWTKEEDKQILEHGATGDDDWTSLAEKLPGRIAKQCSNRYQSLSNKDKMSKSKTQEVKKKGDWTAEEDEKILLHVKNVGMKDWWMVAKDLPGRFPKQCSNRYNNKLSKLSEDKVVVKGGAVEKKKKGKEWTLDEDKIIKDHVAKFGPEKWKIVAKQLPSRVAGGCKNRWFKHLSKEVSIAEGMKDVSISEDKKEVVTNEDYELV